LEAILEVHREDQGPVPIVRATGEIDVSSAPLLREQLESVPEGVPKVIVDLSAVTFLDSTGLSVLVAARKRLRSTNTSAVVHLVVTKPIVTQIFDITGLQTVFAFHQSLADALDA
jgi:anti-sigma B factor antagonist